MKLEEQIRNNALRYIEKHGEPDTTDMDCEHYVTPIPSINWMADMLYYNVKEKRYTKVKYLIRTIDGVKTRTVELNTK